MLQRCNNCVDGKNLEVEIKSDHATDVRETTNHETDDDNTEKDHRRADQSRNG
jgi:hypothetical protein